MINKKTILQYDKKGYLVIKNFLKKKEKNNFSLELFKVYSKILKKEINSKNIHKIISDCEKQKKYDELYSAFRKYCKNQSFKKISKRLSSLAKKIHKNKKFKVVNTGMAIGIKNSTRTAYKWHQEKPYYKNIDTIHFQFPAFGICNKKNGTMSVLEGSHNIGYEKKLTNIKLNEKSINSFVPKSINKLKKKFSEKSVILKEHDLVIFNQCLLHKTNSNKSNKVRFAANLRFKIY
jgi:ectoine hydroxylase-related dioxygenase (phytanoyl-CoA dioxygenase family)